MKTLILLFSIFSSLSVFAKTEFIQFSKHLKLHTGVFGEIQNTKGDILYLHGYGDAFLNHQRLFNGLNKAGLRVISFDFPSHGKTESDAFGDLHFVSFTELAEMAEKVLGHYRKDTSRPLYISGWSTGGLLALRMVQDLSTHLNHQLKGMILYAPGVAVYPCVGEKCFITNRTLNQDNSLQNREIKPNTPLTRPGFATKLVTNAALSWNEELPNVPVQVFVASEDGDKYVISKKLKKWIAQKRSEGANISALECKNAFHELDNETDAVGGRQVREMSQEFASSTLRNKAPKKISGPCQEI